MLLTQRNVSPVSQESSDTNYSGLVFVAGLVVEDAVSGLIAGRAAGARTLAVCTSTKRTTLIECGNPDFIVADLTK